MHRSYSFDVAAWLGGFDVDDEDAMRAGRLVVFRSLADHSVGITDEKIVEGVLLVWTVEALQVVELEFTVGALSRLNSR